MSLSSALHPRTSTSVSSVVHVILTSLPPHPISSPPQSTRCVFLGYYTDHKGYGCLELSTNRLIVSRHVVFDEKNFPLAASPNLTDLDFLCESVSPISTIGTPISFAGSSTALACQAAPIVPSGFEPHMTPMLVPLPAPRVPSGFLLHATSVPSIQRLAVKLPLYRGWRSDCPLWRTNHLGALRRACCFARRGYTTARLADVADRLHPSSRTTCDIVACDSTSPLDHDRTHDTVGEPSPDGHTGQRQFLATS
jgi:hypothetical protein